MVYVSDFVTFVCSLMFENKSTPDAGFSPKLGVVRRCRNITGYSHMRDRDAASAGSSGLIVKSMDSVQWTGLHYVTSSSSGNHACNMCEEMKKTCSHWDLSYP